MQREPQGTRGRTYQFQRSEKITFPHTIGVHLVQRTVSNPGAMALPRKGFAVLVRYNLRPRHTQYGTA
jgi:hypothetical protein